MYNYKDKPKNIKQLNQYMLAKTISMFEYMGLPETLPYREIERMLQENGYIFVTEVNGELYAFNGGLGGELDAYYQPTEIIVTNPALKLNKTFNLKTDGVLIKNDDMSLGLLKLFEKANTFLVENEINMMVQGYNSRTQKLISASDDKTKESAELFIKKSIDGDIAVIGENAMFDGVRLQTAATSQAVTITNMIEFQQYVKGSLYNEIGLSSNFNMKRERLISSELDASEDSLFPLVYNMMKNRLKGVELINKMFNTKIEVDFGSVWHFKNKKLVDDVVEPAELPVETLPTNEGLTDEPTDQPTEQPATEGTNADETIFEETNTEFDSASDSDNQQKEEIEAMLKEPNLSDDDKEALQEMLKELGGE